MLQLTSCALAGPSGAGKTRTMMHVLGVQPAAGIDADVAWDPAVPSTERCGILFQQGALINSLSVQENLVLSIEASMAGEGATPKDKCARAKQLLETFGLSAADHNKMPDELSGGMLRRVALAQLLAQKKRLILLDEPFIGLDPETATGIAKELERLKREEKTAFVLITHLAHYARILEPDTTCTLTPRVAPAGGDPLRGQDNHRLSSRIAAKIWDYVGYSTPLVVCAAIAAGFAICMLLADVLIRTDISESVLQVLEEELSSDDIPDLVKSMAPLIKMKAQSVIDDRAPELKAMLYSRGVAKLFTLELGPLLTALLLAGRIGGSYAGEVATMIATNQSRLLKTLGVSPVAWTLTPSLVAAVIAGPLLTILACGICLSSGGVVAVVYGLEEDSAAIEYRNDVWDATVGADVSWQTYPPFVMLYRSVMFILATMAIAETAGRWNPLLQSRDVPWVITTAVVVSSLTIILFDWGFSQVLLRY